MTHPNVSLILATGGAGMVKSAYSSGNRPLASDLETFRATSRSLPT
ncbi:hypothetical protein PO124_02155 [Bacillus licheniformis]|nr:hypothetical protein [Bacillus licheniformis]